MAAYGKSPTIHRLIYFFTMAGSGWLGTTDCGSHGRGPRFDPLCAHHPSSPTILSCGRSSTHGDLLGRRNKKSKTTPCTVADPSRINGLRLFRIRLLRRAKHGHDGMIPGEASMPLGPRLPRRGCPQSGHCLQQGCDLDRRKVGIGVGNGVGQNNLIMVPHRPAGIDHVGNVALALGRLRMQQRFARTS